MHVVIVSIGSQGDVYPLLGIGAALKTRGHRVTVLANSYFEPATLQAGLDFHSIGSAQDYLNALDEVADTTMRRLLFEHLYLGPMEPVFAYLSRFASNHDTMILCNISALGARLAHEKYGLPMVSVNMGPMMFLSSYDPPLFSLTPYPKWIPRLGFQLAIIAGHQLFDLYLCKGFNRFRKSIGLPYRLGVLRWMPSPQKIIGLFPDWFASPQPDWPSQAELTGFPLFDEGALPHTDLPSGLEKFLDQGEAPIIFTPGTPYKKFTSFFFKAVQATTALGRRAIFLTRFKEQLPPHLPPHIRFFEYAPFSLLLPRAAVLVHHGGIGTMAQAMRAGIPQLVAPWGIDQYDNGARVKALGLGDVISSRTSTVESLTHKLDYLLHAHEVQEQCQKISSRIKTSDPLSDICRIIETVGSEAERPHPSWQPSRL